VSTLTIVDVAPRDGFQSVAPFIRTETKIRIIELLAAAGIRRMEVGSFVSPKAIPQMADIGEVLAKAQLPASLAALVLVPNGKGLARAAAAGVKTVTWVVSVSESHNQSNVRRSVDQSFSDFEVAWRELGTGLALRFALATSFDCPFEGQTPEARVIACVERVLKIVPRLEISIADTTGRAAPNHVSRLFRRLLADYASDDVVFSFHGHDTYNLGVANAIAAYDAGVRIIDGAAGGLGGCPFAPGASGNTATEDLVFAFEHMGIATGIDFAKLLDAADEVARIAPNQASGRVRRVSRKRALAGFGAETRGLPAENY
jgi:hydroxymethylglutaryl-CoA lyase